MGERLLVADDLADIQIAKGLVHGNHTHAGVGLHGGENLLGFSIADFPNAFAMYQNEVTLPLYPSLTEEQVTYVAECLKDNL